LFGSAIDVVLILLKFGRLFCTLYQGRLSITKKARTTVEFCLPDGKIVRLSPHFAAVLLYLFLFSKDEEHAIGPIK